MHWKLSEEQVAYQGALRGWLGDVASPEQVRLWWESPLAGAALEAAADLDARMTEDGMSGVGVAEDLGGQGGGVVELALSAEELGRATAPSGSWLATMAAVAALGRSPDLVTESLAGGAALLVSSGSLPGSARPLEIGVDGRVSGRVDQVLGVEGAQVLLAVVTGPGGPALRRIASGSAAVTPRRLLDRSRSVADVVLDAVPSEVVDVDATAALDRAADLGGVLVAADALGAMERMLEMAVAYSLQRHQFGVPIGSFQAVKHAAASILVDVEAGRSGVYFAAASVEGGHEERAMHAAAVKAQVTAAASRAADTALTMHGAIGYTWEHDLHLLYKRARLDEALWGAPPAWNERLATRLGLTA
ncbi:MAG: hypothetical protein JWN84_3579 [Nocardioides sp.]|nr:hypothetical protein [Nocardioides sp.]